MRKIICLFFISVFAFISCETIEDNSRIIQSNVDGAFFRTNATSAFFTEDGGLTIQGFSSDETLTLHMSDTELIDYQVGEGRPNFAIYEDFNGTVYNTNPLGNGSITLTEECLPCGYYSGNFSFMAVNLTQTDTIAFSGGLFFEIPFDTSTVVAENLPGTGNLSAEINGDTFIAINVSALEMDTSIFISGANSNSTILLRFPNDIGVGNFSVPMEGFTLSYTDASGTQNATNGNLSIITHDTDANTVSGSFSFVTPDNAIQGQFDVTY